MTVWLYFVHWNVCLCCTVDKALPHAVSTDASLGTSLPADALMTARHKSQSFDLDNLSQTVTDFTTLTVADAAASRVRRSARSLSLLPGTDVQVVVAWLESFEDYLTFPVGEFCILSHFHCGILQRCHQCPHHLTTLSACTESENLTNV